MAPLIRTLRSEDVPALESILRATGVFTDEEVGVALELMDIFLNRTGQEDYDIYVAAGSGGEILGYVCIGPTPVTDGTYDLYWIAVDPRCHGRGIGRELQDHVEKLIARQGGRLVVAETSGRPQYENTRKFYISTGYREVARIRDYYRAGDDLVVYGKYLSQ